MMMKSIKNKGTATTGAPKSGIADKAQTQGSAAQMQFSLKSIGKYLRELSVVVIGVAITLSAGQWISNHSEKQDMALYLNMVKLELETNLEDLNWMTGYVEDEARYSHYLLSHAKNALEPDSIRPYGDGIHAIRSITNSSNAFEMFKASGSMRFIKDKNMLLAIWRAYMKLKIQEIHLDVYHNRDKLEELKKAIQLQKEGKPAAVPMYDFYVSPLEYTFSLLHGCEIAKSSLEEAIAKIEKELQGRNF
jgi:hypothetical protein